LLPGIENDRGGIAFGEDEQFALVHMLTRWCYTVMPWRRVFVVTVTGGVEQRGGEPLVRAAKQPGGTRSRPAAVSRRRAAACENGVQTRKGLPLR
jgi:hypothetical protein